MNDSHFNALVNLSEALYNSSARAYDAGDIRKAVELSNYAETLSNTLIQIAIEEYKESRG